MQAPLRVRPTRSDGCFPLRSRNQAIPLLSERPVPLHPEIVRLREVSFQKTCGPSPIRLSASESARLGLGLNFAWRNSFGVRRFERRLSLSVGRTHRLAAPTAQDRRCVRSVGEVDMSFCLPQSTLLQSTRVVQFHLCVIQ